MTFRTEWYIRMMVFVQIFQFVIKINKKDEIVGCFQCNITIKQLNLTIDIKVIEKIMNVINITI
uniref:Uncharacterized protein n=1 Tax=Onchocerca volvulus TaxID=6282 RepID=A0A8R1XZC3_ONCVO